MDYLFKKKASIIVDPITEPFSVREHLIKDIGLDSPTGIVHVTNDFIAMFGNVVEDPIDSKSKIRSVKITSDCGENLLITKIGGREIALCRFGQVHALLVNQYRTEEGMLTRSCSNRFFAYDVKGIFRTVVVSGSKKGRTLDARAVPHPMWIPAGDRVFFTCNKCK